MKHIYIVVAKAIGKKNAVDFEVARFDLKEKAKAEAEERNSWPDRRCDYRVKAKSV
jgi:hypothetical protein